VEYVIIGEGKDLQNAWKTTDGSRRPTDPQGYGR
jgi:hypothetical protein